MPKSILILLGSSLLGISLSLISILFEQAIWFLVSVSVSGHHGASVAFWLAHLVFIQDILLFFHHVFQSSFYFQLALTLRIAHVNHIYNNAVQFIEIQFVIMNEHILENRGGLAMFILFISVYIHTYNKYMYSSE